MTATVAKPLDAITGAAACASLPRATAQGRTSENDDAGRRLCAARR
jgi:hypothetical protein